jgi:hypothetical protein
MSPVQSYPRIQTTSSRETFSESVCHETRACYETYFCFETTDLLRNNSNDSNQYVVSEKLSVFCKKLYFYGTLFCF